MTEASQGVVSALAVLSRLIEVAPADLEGMAKLAAAALAGCDGAALSVLGDAGRVAAAAASDERTMGLDALQYQDYDSPCLAAMRTAAVVQVADFRLDARFPEFASAAVATGVSGCLSLPLMASNVTLGCLNFYRDGPGPYDQGSLAGAGEIGDLAARMLALSRAHQVSVELATKLQLAVASQAAIEQAKGVLMARGHCDADRALDVLRQAAHRQQVKLGDVADAIVADISKPRRDGASVSEPRDPVPTGMTR